MRQEKNVLGLKRPTITWSGWQFFLRNKKKTIQNFDRRWRNNERKMRFFKQLFLNLKIISQNLLEIILKIQLINNNYKVSSKKNVRIILNTCWVIMKILTIKRNALDKSSIFLTIFKNLVNFWEFISKIFQDNLRIICRKLW